MMRLFVAVSLPDAGQNYLRSLKQDISGLKWTPAENMHLTLRFSGMSMRKRLLVPKTRFMRYGHPLFQYR
jgi:2'-5' RNA ligase